MAELLVVEDVEVAARAELLASTPAEFKVPVATSLLSDPEFIRCTVVGGTSRDLVTDRPTLLVEAFAKSEGRAERIAAYGLAVLEASGRNRSLGGLTCYGVEALSRPQNLPHPLVPDYFRFQFSVSADVRKSAV